MDKTINPSISALLRSGAQLLGPLPFPVPEPFETYELSTNGFKRQVDIYQPPEGGPLTGTAVLIVHGGGFLVGSRLMKPVKGLMGILTQQGAWVAAMDYTLLPRGGTLAQMTAEVRDTLLWCRQYRWGDTSERPRLNAIGLSAGVAPLFHATSLLGNEGPDGLISIYGALEFTPNPARVIQLVYRRLLRDNCRSRWPEQSPAKALFKRKFEGPVLFLHGGADQVCPPSTSRKLHEIRLADDLPSEIVLFPGQQHGFMNNPLAPESKHAFDVIVDFLGKQEP